MFEIKRVKDINLEEWNELLLNSPEATIFHTKEWLSVIEKSYKDRIVNYIIGRDENKKLVCGLPIIKYRRLGFLALTSTIWGTPLLLTGTDELIREAVLKDFAEFYKKINVIYLSQNDYSNKCQYLGKLGFECQKDFLHRLELTSSFDHLQEKKFNRCIGKNIRSAIKNGVILEGVKDMVQVEQYYDVAKHTYLRRGGKMIYSFEFYRNVFEIMLPKNLIRWHLAKKDGIVIAGALHFVYKDTVFDLLDASYKEYQNLRPNDLLVYSMIKWGVENRYKYYNFGASPLKAQGLIRFKENWGAEKMEYPVYEKKKRLFKIAGFLKR